MGKKTAAQDAANKDPAERWQQVKAVFLQAIEREDSERDAYLLEACGTDQDLRSEVESLIHCHLQAVAGGFLSELPESSSPRAVLEAMAAAFDVTSAQSQTHGRTSERGTQLVPGIIDVPADDRFGDYRLLEPIGQGGMGIVYRARQLSLNRVVALKMIRTGRFSTPGEIERFAREAEAAAGLTHPGIVPVFEIGEEEGHHYYTMAWIDGLSLADHLKNAVGPLEPKEAAELIRQVTDAVEYAHEHGVIHRDLKPANILLDEHGAPRVVDFGLAKHTEAESALTYTGQVLGTPSFMSPEQAGGGTSQVGPTADLYALGAVLYMLLTGRPPFNAASVTETLRQVQHDEPVRPRQLNSALPKDLETICLKCLVKEPSKRYGSARELGDELKRYLAGRPILARPVGRLTSASRWCRRNPLAASFITFVAIFVPAVIVILSVMIASLLSKSQEVEFKEQLAQRNFVAAKNAVDELFTLVSEETLLDRPGLQPLRRRLLLGASKYYEYFLATHGDDPVVQLETARINFRLGVSTASLNADGDHDVYAAANRYLTTARQIYERFPDQDDRRVLEGLGHVWNRLGHVRNKLQQQQHELEAFQAALKFRRRLIEVNSTPENQRLLANAHMNLGQAMLHGAGPAQPQLRDDALALLDTAQALREHLLEQDPGNAKVMRDQVKGHLLSAAALTEDQAPARALHLLSAFTILEARSKVEPPTLEETFLRGIIAKRLGGITADGAADADDLRRAAEYFEQALSLLNPLAAENPQVVDYLSALAATYHESGLVLQDLQSDTAARDRFETTLRLLTPLIKGRNPDDILRWAGAHANLAELEPRHSTTAIQHLRDARGLLLRKLEATSRDDAAARAQYESAVEEIDRILADHIGV